MLTTNPYILQEYLILFFICLVISIMLYKGLQKELKEEREMVSSYVKQNEKLWHKIYELENENKHLRDEIDYRDELIQEYKKSQIGFDKWGQYGETTS